MLNFTVTLQLIAATSIIMWLILFFFRGQFWRADQRLIETTALLKNLPEIVIIIPARNEERLLRKSVTSLLRQNYKGRMSIIIIDDNSSDNTRRIIQSLCKENKNIQMIKGTKTSSGWTGKLWAMAQGVELAKKIYPNAKYFLFTDSDIFHHTKNVTQLIAKAHTENLALVSLMVKLRCKSMWEVILIPAFIFFFQKLYPFSWVNDEKIPTGAAAGGCMIVNCKDLEKAGGLGIIKGAIIDDCALAVLLKKNNPIWLGLTKSTESLREYHSFFEIAQMVSRTAFVQLKFSIPNVFIAILGMLIIYLMPFICILIGLTNQDTSLFTLGLAGWLMMFLAYIPTLKLYTRPIWEASLLPTSAFLYAVMTIMSACQYILNKEPNWKGRPMKKEKNVPQE